MRHVDASCAMLVSSGQAVPGLVYYPAGANALFQIAILVPGTKLQLAAET